MFSLNERSNESRQYVPGGTDHDAGNERFLGYLNRRPYLWWVDLERRIVEPAAELTWIPQGVDEVVPLGDVVAVRCGPRAWFGLRPSLTGGGFDLPPVHRVEAERRSSQVGAVWGNGVAPMDARVRVPDADGEEWEVTHPEIQRWSLWGTLSPNRRSLAVVGYTGPPPESLSVADISDGREHIRIPDPLSLRTWRPGWCDRIEAPSRDSVSPLGLPMAGTWLLGHPSNLRLSSSRPSRRTLWSGSSSVGMRPHLYSTQTSWCLTYREMPVLIAGSWPR